MATKIEQMLIEYGKNAENRKLQTYYSRKSYMEKLGIARAEEPHSAYWANLLKGDDVNCDKKESPLMWFLQVLVNRETTATAYGTTSPIPADMKISIISRTLDFQIEEIKAEKKIKEIANKYFSTNPNWSNVSEPCEDELDIYIKCAIRGVQGIDKLEIIVENKVTQKENGPKAKKNQLRPGYDDKCQTVRYYNACNSTSSSNKVQLFVLLTPDTTGIETTATDKHFIQISYQDLLDTILLPLIESDSLLDRQRFEIKDYVDVLNLPTLDIKESQRIIMAKTTEQADAIHNYVDRNRLLLCEALKAKIRKEKGMNSLTDDDLLLKFIDSNKNVLWALACSSYANLVDHIVDGKTGNIYLINDELKVYGDATFGQRFLEFFYEQNKHLLKDNLPFCDQLNDMLKQFFGTSTSWYGVKNKDPKHYNVIDKDNDLSAMFGNFGAGQNLAKLIKGLNTNSPDWFRFEKL